MSARSAPRRLALLPLSLLGLLAGHWLNYLLIEPDAAHRATRLAGTGHGYLHAAVPAAFALAAVALTSVLWAGLARGRLGRGRQIPRFVRMAASLAGGQAAGFVVLEVVERLAANAGLHDVNGPLLALGMLVQVSGAALITALVVGLDRAAESAGRMLRRSHLPAVRELTSTGRPPSVLASRNRLRVAFGVRGPPHGLRV